MEKLKMALEISGIILQAAQVIVLTALTVKLYQYIKAQSQGWDGVTDVVRPLLG